MWEYGGDQGGGIQRIWDFDAEPDPPPAGWWDQLGLFHAFGNDETMQGHGDLHGARVLPSCQAAGAEWGGNLPSGHSAAPGLHLFAQPGAQNANYAAPAETLPAPPNWSNAAVGHGGGVGGGGQSWSARLADLQRGRAEAKGGEFANVAATTHMSGQQAWQQAPLQTSLQAPEHAPSSVGSASGAAAALSGARAPKPPKENKEKEKKKGSKHGAPPLHPHHALHPHDETHEAHQARPPTPAPARKDSAAIFQVQFPVVCANP
jgi:hypothetical protein